MIKEGASMLTIQGKAKKSALKKVTDHFAVSPNQQWFFVDYATTDIPLHSKFDVLLEGESKQLVSSAGSYTIKLLTCLDQFGNQLDCIPKGFKTICKLEAHPSFPTRLNKLSALDQWDYNPAAISIADHEDLEIAFSDELLFSLCVIAFAELKKQFGGPTRQEPLYKGDLIDYLKKSFQTPTKSAWQIVAALMQLGKVTRKQGNQLELAD